MYDYLLSEPRINSRYEILTLVSLFFFFPYIFFLGGEGDDFWKKNSCLQIRIMLCSRVPFNATKGVTQTHKKPATFYILDSRDAHPTHRCL